MLPPGSEHSSPKATSRQAKSMSGQLSMFELMNSTGSASAISLPGLADGPSPSDMPDGAITIPSGPDRARVSRSRLPAGASVSETTGTSGQSSGALSPSDALQRSLESRLRVLLTGSDLCEVIWKPWNTPWGQCLSKPRARVRTTSGIASGSWPTPQARDHFPAHSQEYIASKKALGHGMANLNDVAMWATPAARDWRSDRSQKSSQEIYGAKGRPLPRQAIEASPWPTPTSLSGGSETSNPPGNSRNNNLIRAHAIGQSAQTEKPGALNPEFVCWLMGFPAAWVSCGVSAMQSIRGQQRRSSKPRATRSRNDSV